jgi:hypothetical protein
MHFFCSSSKLYGVCVVKIDGVLYTLVANSSVFILFYFIYLFIYLFLWL